MITLERLEMSGDSREIVYWDSCIFIAFLKGENHGDSATEAIRIQAAEFDANKIVLATSTVGIMEVLSMELTDEVKDKFEKMIRRSNFVIIEANEFVARKAAVLRNHCYAKSKEAGNLNFKVTPADAIHVSSGMAVLASKIVTTDKKDKKSKGELGMVSIAKFYPVTGLPSTPILYPSLGVNGDKLI